VALSYDPEFATVFAPLAELLAARPAAIGDWQTLREEGNAGLALLAAAGPDAPGVDRTDVQVPGYQGAPIAVRLYRKAGSDPRSGIVYFHGGGMVLGSMELYDKAVAMYVAESGVPMLSVDYRLAPEHPHPVPVEDCFASLLWLHDHAAEFGIERARIGVMGDSAGGGLAAGTAILARDRALPLGGQILIDPMLDDRTVVPDPELVPFALWTYDSNMTGWDALLGEQRGTNSVPPVAAPARERNLAGLAPAYIEVGELDIFRDEDVEYARRLSRAGVSAELHVHPGLPHGFDAVAGATAVGVRSRADRIRVIQSL
jgi:acetyl esterase/lipase